MGMVPGFLGRVGSRLGGLAGSAEEQLSQLLSRGASSGLGRMANNTGPGVGYGGQFANFGEMGGSTGGFGAMGPAASGLGSTLGNAMGPVGDFIGNNAGKIGLGMGIAGIGAGTIANQMQGPIPGAGAQGGANPAQNMGGASGFSQAPNQAPQPYQAGQRVGQNSRGTNQADLKNPQQAVSDALMRRGMNLQTARNDPKVRYLLQNVDQLMLPVYDALRADPSNYNRLNELIDEQVGRALSGNAAYYDAGAGQQAWKSMMDSVQPYATGGKAADPNNPGLNFLIETLTNPQSSQSLFSNLAYGGVGQETAGTANRTLQRSLGDLDYLLRNAPAGTQPDVSQYTNLIDLLTRGLPSNMQSPTARSPYPVGGYR